MLGHMNARERTILWHTCFGHFLSHFNMLAFPALVIPLTGLLGLDMAAVLGLSFWMYLLYGLMALPWGMVADRIGVRVLFVVFYLGAGLSGLAAAAWSHNPFLLQLSLAGVGLFSAIYHPVGLGMISKEIRKVGLGMGFNGMFGNLGLACAPFVAGLVTWAWGPRAAFVSLGLINMCGAVFMLLWPLDLSGSRPETVEAKGNSSFKPFLILLAAMMLGGIVYRGGTVILPAYFEVKNQALADWLSAMAAGLLPPNMVATATTSLIFLMGMAGQYLGGHVAQRYDVRKTYLFFHAMTVPLAVLAGTLANLPLVVVVMAYFFFLLGMQPSENTLVGNLSPHRFRHAAFGFKFILTFGVGSLAVKMVAAIQSGLSIEAVFPSLAVVSVLLVAAILLLIHQTRPQNASP